MPIRKNMGGNEVLFPEITIDYETTILPEEARTEIMEGIVSKNIYELFAYSVQIGLLYQSKDDKQKTINRFENHIFLDERLRITAKPDNNVHLHIVKGDCVIAAVQWLEELYRKRRTGKSRKTKYSIGMQANAFNAGFEESYSVYSLLKYGYESVKVIPKGMGGVMISEFRREEEYAGRDGEIKHRGYVFKIKETSGQWAAGVRLSDIFAMYGLGKKTETPLLTYSDGEFYYADSGALAEIDADFLRYAAKDVEGLFKALLKKRVENGQPRTMTASSTTKYQHELAFIEKNSKTAYATFFAPASIKFDSWIRPHTLGGYNFVERSLNNIYQDERGGFVRFLGIDRTNAYLSVMCSGFFPYGEAIPFDGVYVSDDVYTFHFQKIRINSCILKKGYMPSLQYKHAIAEDVFSITDLTPETDRFFIVNAEELALFLESYDAIDFEYVDGYKFQQERGEVLFGDYLKDKFYKRKAIKEEIKALKAEKGVSQERDRKILQLTAQADTYKLWGNGLYGKEFENPNKTQGWWWIDEDDNVIYSDEPVIMEKRSPSHMGSQILRKQRCALIKACNKVIKAGGMIFQCDTDAFLCGINRKMALKYPDLTPETLCQIAGIEYGEDLGQWHIEKDAQEGITVEKKVYAWSCDRLTKEERNITFAELISRGHKFYFGTRGVKKSDAIAQLTPNTWRKGSIVETTQFARLAKGRKGQIKIKKVLAI